MLQMGFRAYRVDVRVYVTCRYHTVSNSMGVSYPIYPLKGYRVKHNCLTFTETEEISVKQRGYFGEISRCFFETEHDQNDLLASTLRERKPSYAPFGLSPARPPAAELLTFPDRSDRRQLCCLT